MTGQASMLTESKNNVIGTNPTGGVIEAAKKRAKQQQKLMSQLGSVAQNTRRTVISNNWTDQSQPLVIEGEEKSSKPATDNVAEEKNEDGSGGGSSYYGESEESEWEEEEEEAVEDVEVQNEGKRPGDLEQRSREAAGKAVAPVKKKSRAADDKKEANQKVPVANVNNQPYDPRTDNILSIPNDSVIFNESMQNFKPPMEV